MGLLFNDMAGKLDQDLGVDLVAEADGVEQLSVDDGVSAVMTGAVADLVDEVMADQLVLSAEQQQVFDEFRQLGGFLSEICSVEGLWPNNLDRIEDLTSEKWNLEGFKDDLGEVCSLDHFAEIKDSVKDFVEEVKHLYFRERRDADVSVSFEESEHSKIFFEAVVAPVLEMIDRIGMSWTIGFMDAGDETTEKVKDLGDRLTTDHLTRFDSSGLIDLISVRGSLNEALIVIEQSSQFQWLYTQFIGVSREFLAATGFEEFSFSEFAYYYANLRGDAFKANFSNVIKHWRILRPFLLEEEVYTEERLVAAERFMASGLVNNASLEATYGEGAINACLAPLVNLKVVDYLPIVMILRSLSNEVVYFMEHEGVDSGEFIEKYTEGFSEEDYQRLSAEYGQDLLHIRNCMVEKVFDREGYESLMQIVWHFLREGDPHSQVAAFRYIETNVQAGLNYQFGEVLQLTKGEVSFLADKVWESLISRAERQVGWAVRLVASAYEGDFLAEKYRRMICENGEILVSLLLDGDEDYERLVIAVTGISDFEAGALRELLELLEREKMMFSADFYQPKYFAQYVEAATIEGIEDAVKGLSNLGGFVLDNVAVRALPQIVENFEEVSQEVFQARKQLNGFVYKPYEDGSGNVVWEPGQVLNKYFETELMNNKESILDLFVDVEEVEEIYLELMYALLLEQLVGKEFLSVEEARARAEDKEAAAKFVTDLKSYLVAVADENHGLAAGKRLLDSRLWLGRIIMNPNFVRDVLRLPEEAPEVVKYCFGKGMQGGFGVKASLSVLFSEDLFGQAMKVQHLLRVGVSVPRKMFDYFVARFEKKIGESNSRYPVSFIPKVKTISPYAPRSDEMYDYLAVPFAEGDISQLVARTRLEQDEIERLIESQDGVPFKEFSLGAKKVILGYWVHRVFDLSNDLQAQKEANERNKLLAEEKQTLVLTRGMRFHVTAVDQVFGMLRNGNYAGEILDGYDTDLYPFHVDLGVVEEKDEGAVSNFGEMKYQHLLGGDELRKIDSWGKKGKLEEKGQVFVLYGEEFDFLKEHRSYHIEIECGKFLNHELVLAGVPSVEVTGLVARNEEVLNHLKLAVCNGRFYVPIYNWQGELVFSFADYQKMKIDYNLVSRVDSWDWHWKVRANEVKTSNTEGGLYIGTDDVEDKDDCGWCEVNEFYLKKSFLGEGARVATEELADRLYRRAKIRVPESDFLFTEGRFVRRTKWIEGEELSLEEVQQLPGWKEGAAMDCWLANWDIAQGRNVIVVSELGDQQVVRLDNGGALDRRGQGMIKSRFTRMVGEAEFLENENWHYAFGMLQLYPGLTEEEIKDQVRRLSVNFPDEVIDQMVDETKCMSKQQRSKLRYLLKARKEYLVNRFIKGRDKWEA